MIEEFNLKSDSQYHVNDVMEISNLRISVNSCKFVDKPFTFIVERNHSYHVNDVMTISNLRISVN